MACFLKRTCQRLQFIVCAFKFLSYLGCPLRIGVWSMRQVQIDNRSQQREKKGPIWPSLISLQLSELRNVLERLSSDSAKPDMNPRTAFVSWACPPKPMAPEDRRGFGSRSVIRNASSSKIGVSLGSPLSVRAY